MFEKVMHYHDPDSKDRPPKKTLCGRPFSLDARPVWTPVTNTYPMCDDCEDVYEAT